ncbi:putative flavin-containing monooxygenase 2 [Benincasa hispida]|uniref:putative flavin-containing monooxygenase 2 n=1 Tax=Benincasa hispida TaxID=102211 RepID=UPI0018FFF924|nr:putative flavin-containing monooxygenase 2 [Benincasa hispida]
MAENKQPVAIIGAGISGLIACKFVAQKGLHPVVYEAEDGIGGVWARTINSTKLQNHKSTYEFCDFPWPSFVQSYYPSHQEVLDYLHSYAIHFDLLHFINFNSRVFSIDYDIDGGETTNYSYELWGGNGLTFAKEPRWILEVQNTKNNTVQVHRAGFVILCMGKYSGMPYILEFPPNEGSEVFHGKVLIQWITLPSPKTTWELTQSTN